MFLLLRNADSPLGKFLRSEASATKNIYSFGFGKVRHYGEWFSPGISTVFQSRVLHSNYPACVIFNF